MEAYLRADEEHNPGRTQGPRYVHVPAAQSTAGAWAAGPTLVGGTGQT